jgi:hypothetical protein
MKVSSPNDATSSDTCSRGKIGIAEASIRFLVHPRGLGKAIEGGERYFSGWPFRRRTNLTIQR